MADPGSVKITVTPTGGNPLQADFTISPKSAGGVLKAPTIDSLKPPSAAPGEDVILTGQGFGTSGTVFFDKVPAASKSWTDTSITLTVPTVSPGPVKIAVTPTGSNPLQLDFTVTALQAQPTV